MRQDPRTLPEPYLIKLDREGRRLDPDALPPALEELREQPIADVFLISHGWLNDLAMATEAYRNWTGEMAACRRAEPVSGWIASRRPGFRALTIGIYWPSMPFPFSDLYNAPPPADRARRDWVEDRVEVHAARLGATPVMRDSLHVIEEVHAADPDPQIWPRQALDPAYDMLDRESGLRADGVGAAPGDDRWPFQAKRVFEFARKSGRWLFGPHSLVLAPLRVWSFWYMKRRALEVGRSGVAPLLRDLQAAAEPDRQIRFHLIGHSFGALVCTAALLGPEGQGPLRPVDSLYLIQGAFSLWSFAARIPDVERPG
jgi:hypothetical protein